MTLNKRYIVESVIFSAILLIVFSGISIVRGMLVTVNHVPEIDDNFAALNQFDQQVSFGTAGLNWFLLLGMFLLLIVVYYAARTLLANKKKGRQA